MRSRIVVTGVLLGVLWLSGCAMVEPTQHAVSSSLEMFKPNTNDYRDSTLDDEDAWDIVGKEGRGHLEAEKDPDGWWQKYIMSPKARSIERNLGIE